MSPWKRRTPNGLVHRDIKPANIHIGRSSDRRHDFVKVLDFGLVKSIDGRSTEHSLATAPGNVAGTPSYMAPEMALGENFDGHADIYAVGCVGYFLLTGHIVFDAPTDGDDRQHIRDTPVRRPNTPNLPIPAELDP